MNTPADTTLHLQLEMADEEVRKAVEERVREIVRHVLETDYALTANVIARHMPEVERAALRALRNHLSNSGNIY